ncbi:hypothetical protein VTN00DRAFT_244 [Thermoascus crustaceus]|uniref:uncharacterized protein n=1 Tax=Thermoascus crustaceus TaxID=5088 RepID=UPI0037445C68
MSLSSADANDQNQCNEHMATFTTVAANIRLDNLLHLASSIRGSILRPEKTVRTNAIVDSISCTVRSPPLYGSFHVLYLLEFWDGIRWLLKVPATGYRGRFDENAARSLTSEALTMRLLKRETTIPVPEVYHFDATLDNSLCVPFILMEYIAGVPLYECWFNRTIPKRLLERRRLQTLKDLTMAMTQLNQFTFSRGGSPLFDKDGNLSGVGPLKMIDYQARLDRFKTDDASEGPAIFCEVEPFNSPKSFLLCMLNRRDSPSDAYSQGLYRFLRLLIDWIPQPACKAGQEFVLSHPDFDIQNVIVTEDGRLRGLVDWDGVAMVPRCLGNQRYPSWLTRDLDPVAYRYDPELEDAESNCYENSPDELRHYRTVYRELMKSSSLLSRPKRDRGNPSAEGNDSSSINPESLTKWTSASLVIENLKIAADDPVCTLEIVEKIFEEIQCVLINKSQDKTATENQDQATNDDDSTDSDSSDDSKLCEIAYGLVDGTIAESQLKEIRDAFLALCFV